MRLDVERSRRCGAGLRLRDQVDDAAGGTLQDGRGEGSRLDGGDEFGVRIRAPGPRMTATSSMADSTPRATPTRSASPGSNVEPSAAAGGKHVAGTLSLSPRWSLSPACLRSPWGPSVSMIDGTAPTALVVQKSAPLVSAA